MDGPWLKIKRKIVSVESKISYIPISIMIFILSVPLLNSRSNFS